MLGAAQSCSELLGWSPDLPWVSILRYKVRSANGCWPRARKTPAGFRYATGIMIELYTTICMGVCTNSVIRTRLVDLVVFETHSLIMAGPQNVENTKSQNDRFTIVL